jgi:hypothetical protein
LPTSNTKEKGLATIFIAANPCWYWRKRCPSESNFNQLQPNSTALIFSWLSNEDEQKPSSIEIIRYHPIAHGLLGRMLGQSQTV